MKTLYLTLTLCLLTSPAWAAPTFDAASSSEGTTSTSHDQTVAADANIIIVCLAIRDTAGAVQPATAVTVEGAAATFLVGASNAVIRTELWYKLAPTTGVGVTIAATGDATTDAMVTGAMSFKAVAQSSTFNTAASATGSSADVDVVTIASAVGEMVAYCGAGQHLSATYSADAATPVSTERYEDLHSGLALGGFGYTEDGAATSINIRVDATTIINFAAVAGSMRPLAASTRRAVAPIMFQ